MITLAVCGAVGAWGASLPDAAERGERAALSTLIAQGADINEAHPDGMTALHWAAYRDDAESARLLLKAGADAAAQNRYGVTPLSMAATNGSAAIIGLLLEAGVDANTALPGGETVLMTAARTGKVDAVRVLLDAGADLSAAEESGQTALMWAAAAGHVEVVDELITRGADPHVKVESGYTPFFFAVREGRIGAVDSLLAAGIDVNEPFTPKRINRKAPKAGSSALLLAVSNGHFELAARLLAAGADPNEATPGYTPLHRVVNYRKPGQGDNDPAPPGSGAMTSLEFTRKLIAAGADVNARMTKDINLGNTSIEREGATAFFLAAHSADIELLKLLVELGADPTIPNKENTTPLMAAAGIGTRSPGEDAGLLDEVDEVLAYLLDLGADANAIDDHGETAMHGAAYKNAPGAVELLAARGADIAVWNRENEFGWTPLVIALGYRFGNFKPSQVTIDAVAKAMLAEGVTPDFSVKPKSREIY